MNLSSSILKAKPYRYCLLLYDFIKRTPFEIVHSGERVIFDYMGNPTKFFTPDKFHTYHDVSDALSWMKSSEMLFKHGTMVYSLMNIVMPKEYDHGIKNEFYHTLTGLSIVVKLLRNKKVIGVDDLLRDVSLLNKKVISIDKNRTIELDLNVSRKTIDILTSDLFNKLFREEFIYACSYVNKPVVSDNIDRLILLDKYKIKVVIGDNRGITVNDLKLFESVNGNFKEIKLETHTRK